MTVLPMGLIDLHTSNKKLFAYQLKHTSFWLSADVKPMANDLIHAMP
jgi:hypothetical protein